MTGIQEEEKRKNSVEALCEKIIIKNLLKIKRISSHKDPKWNV